MTRPDHKLLRRLSAALMKKVAPEPERPLTYVRADGPAITRRRRGKGFVYLRPDGQRLRSAEDLARIRALAIPPAWTEVRICPTPTGHIQATGRDARGRKQYRYHARWNAMRNENKFERLATFGKLLPRIRRRTREHLRLPGLPREKVLALVVRLLEHTMIRIGNREYRKANRSFGLTTLHDRHVEVRGSKARFRFRGKSGKEHTIDVDDARLARLVSQCRDIPGQELFQYIDDRGEPQTIGSGDVNDYLRAISGQEFTAKDFRTWGGTVLAAEVLAAAAPARSQAEAKRGIARGIESVAAQLGNTTTICKRYYVHTVVLDAYASGRLHGDRGAGRKARPGAERLVMSLLASARTSRRRERTALRLVPKSPALGSRPRSRPVRRAVAGRR